MRFLTLLAFFPSIALAAPTTYNLIAPVGSLTGAVNLKDYLNGVFVTVIGIGGILAVIMIVICGIKLMGSGSVSGKSEAKECIWNAVFGILIAIGSWLLLNTINPLLLKNDAELTVQSGLTPGAGAQTATSDRIPRIPGWYYRYDNGAGVTKNSPRFDTSASCLALQRQEIDNGITITNECFEVSPPVPGTPPPPPPAPAPAPAPGPVTAPSPTQSGSEQATRNALCGNDSCVGSKPVGINKNACIGSNTSCTNVAGLDSGAGAGTVAHIKGVAGSCGCDVVITGGTEGGHASHGPSIPVFDLSRTQKLVDFIKTNATVKANPSFCLTNGGTCFQKWLYNGYWYSDEIGGGVTPHFHVCKDGTTAPAGKSVNLFKKACTQI